MSNQLNPEEKQQPPPNPVADINTDSNADAAQQPIETENETTTPTETDNMEVHKHPHHVTNKKKWSEYLLEFIMLFLAIFLGFLAENYREQEVNEKIEKKNIESFIASVQKDSARLAINIEQCQYKIKLIDSLGKIPGNFNDTSFQKPFFNYARQLTKYEGYMPDESAFLQMQYSGTLRLIKKQNITDSILKYQTQNAVIKGQRETVNNYFEQSLNNLLQITDLRKKPLEYNGNEQQMHSYINFKMAESISSGFYINVLKRQLDNIKSLLPFLNKEYNISE